MSRITVGVHRRLRRLAQQGLVAHVVPSSEDLPPQWCSYLTNAGVSHAAQLAGLDLAAFAHHCRLTDAGLLRRIIRLEQLVSSRGFLLNLLAGVRARGEPGLVPGSWQGWPAAVVLPLARHAAPPRSRRIFAARDLGAVSQLHARWARHP